MTLQAAIEKHFFEIFEHIHTRRDHTKLMLPKFWDEVDSSESLFTSIDKGRKFIVIVGCYKFEFSEGIRVMGINELGSYTKDVFMTKL